MRKIIVPVVAYAALVSVYFTQSSAPLYVHALSFTIFAVAFLVPSLWAAHIAHPRHRLVVCGLCAFLAMLAWDATAHLVIVEAEQFSILLHTSWLYALGALFLIALSFATAWVTSPPNQAFKRTGFASRLF